MEEGQISSRLHMTCPRQVHDLPGSDAAVSAELVVPKFFCDNPDWQTIFCMRLTPWVPAYGQRSTRLTQGLADGRSVPKKSLRPRILGATLPPPWILGIDHSALAKGASLLSLHIKACILGQPENLKQVHASPLRSSACLSPRLEMMANLSRAAYIRQRGPRRGPAPSILVTQSQSSVFLRVINEIRPPVGGQSVH